MPSIRTGEYIAPVGPDGKRGWQKKHAQEGVEKFAVRIVADQELLLEVLRRACLVDPDAVRRALSDADARYESIRRANGDYTERYVLPYAQNRPDSR